MFNGFANAITCLVILTGLLCTLSGCAHQETLADEMRSAEHATDADVPEAVKRLLDTPQVTMFDIPYRRLIVLAPNHGPKIVEELLRQGTARRTEFNSNDNPVWPLLGFLRIGAINWDDAFAVGAELLKSEDPHLKEVAGDLLGLVFLGIFGGLPDSDVVAYLKTHPPDQNRELIEWVVGTSPERGLRILSDPALMPAEEGRNLQWAAHLIEEVHWREANHFADKLPADKQAAIEQLHFLAGRPEWWARHYAAATIQTNKSLADPATEQKLKNDPNPRVREVMNPPPRDTDAKQPEPPTPQFPVIGGRKR